MYPTDLYLHKANEVLAIYEQDEAKIESWEKAGLYSVREVTEMLERLRETRDWLLKRLERDCFRWRRGGKEVVMGSELVEW